MHSHGLQDPGTDGRRPGAAWEDKTGIGFFDSLMPSIAPTAMRKSLHGFIHENRPKLTAFSEISGREMRSKVIQVASKFKG